MKTIQHLDHELKPLGYGAYPYDCEAKRKWPTAMVYASDTCWDFDKTDLMEVE